MIWTTSKMATHGLFYIVDVFAHFFQLGMVKWASTSTISQGLRWGGKVRSQSNWAIIPTCITTHVVLRCIVEVKCCSKMAPHPQPNLCNHKKIRNRAEGCCDEISSSCGRIHGSRVKIPCAPSRRGEVTEILLSKHKRQGWPETRFVASKRELYFFTSAWLTNSSTALVTKSLTSSTDPSPFICKAIRKCFVQVHYLLTSLK